MTVPFGYYAMPLLWGDAVIGWANVALVGGRLQATLGYARPCPQSQVFRRSVDAELARIERFLSIKTTDSFWHDDADESTMQENFHLKGKG